jgi:N-glycosylase/DNA lyase
VSRLSVAVPPDFDLAVTACSHGWYDLPPFAWDPEARRLSSVALLDGRACDLAIVARANALAVEAGPAPRAASLRATVESMLRLDADLSGFYQLADDDPALAWTRGRGAGRLLRAPSVFEDVVKMLCTTNCSWSLTRLMVTRLVDRLGATAPSGARAFPTPESMAAVGERFYRDEARAGYRAPHLVTLSRKVASGAIDLEVLRANPDTAEVRERLLALPGIGPYAADNLLRLLGHYDHLGLDSWCRGKLKKLYPRIRDPDAFAERRYRRYQRWQGLAMWLDITRDWHEAGGPQF